MAYGRRYWRRYYRRYYRGRYNNSYWKTRMTRNFKASANNMTQGGTFNISCHKEVQLQLPAPQAGTANTMNYDKLDLPAIIASSDMHTYLSNVFDQYRVEKLTIRIRPIGNDRNTIVNPSICFSAVDRTDFANNLSIDVIRTYGSYRETQISGDKAISPTHTCYIGQSNLVEWSTYTDTKNRVTFPSVIWGCVFGHISGPITVSASIEIDAMVRYRGVRLDTRTVNPNEDVPVSELLIDRVVVKGHIADAGGDTWNTIPVTKVTGSTFSLGQRTIVYAVKMSGDGAGKIIRGYYVAGGIGSVEFDTDPDYNIYKSAELPEASANMEICLEVYCQNLNDPIRVGVGEAPDDGDVSLTIDNWQESIVLP